MTLSLSTSRLSAILALTAVASASVIVACNGSDVGTSIAPAYDAGAKEPEPKPEPEPTVDAGTDGETTDGAVTSDAAPDAPAVVSPCTQAQFDANDHSGDASFNQVDISVERPDGGSFLYVNACSKIKVNGFADFAMDFVVHPLVPTASTPANPIPNQTTAADGGDVKVQFTAAGTYLFHCGNHASMKGAIQVVP